MTEEWGPFITGKVIWGNAAFAIFASLIWAGGHAAWLMINNKAPSWMRNQLIDRQYKSRDVYLAKLIAWGLIIWPIYWQLFVPLQGDAVRYKPIIGNVLLQDVGGVTVLLIIFLFLTGFYRWLTREKRK